MIEIKAYIHGNRIAAVIDALDTANWPSGAINNIAVTTVESLGQAVSVREQRYSMRLAQSVITEYQLALLCIDDIADMVIQSIEAAARTGQGEAGWIYAIPVERVRRIGKGMILPGNG